MAPACLLHPCRLHNLTPFGSFSGTKVQGRQRILLLRAVGNGEGPSGSKSVDDKETSLERLEASIRGKATSAPPKSAPKPIPIRGVTHQERTVDSQYENMAEWREGQLFPDGWEEMDLGKKLTELYLGRRGVLFWMNKAAYASVFALLGGWVLFRFVGPALGLYRLAGDFQAPPM